MKSERPVRRIRVTVWLRENYAEELRKMAESRRSQGAVVEMAMDYSRKDIGARPAKVVFKVARLNGRLKVLAT